MEVKIIILGAGEVGYHTAQRLSEEDHDVIMIDKNPEMIKRIEENLDVHAFLGSGTSPRLLKESGIREADMLVAATDSDEVNLIACLLAKNLNQAMIKIARVRNKEYLDEKDIFGKDLLGVDHIINPESAMSNSILAIMEIPGASEVIDFVEGSVKLIGLNIKTGTPFCGRKLKSFREMEEKFLVGAIMRGENVIIPSGQDTIEPEDLVYVVVKKDEFQDILRIFSIGDEALRRVIIVGAGQTGTALSTALDKKKINAKIIEKNKEKCDSLSQKLQKVIVINGDGTDETLLKEENISDVDFVIAVTDDEQSNVFISLLSKRLGAKKTVTRINRLSYISLVSAIGIDTVVSSRLSAIRSILQEIRRGKIISVTPLKGEHAEAIEAEALETSDIVNSPLSEVKFPKGAIVVTIVRNGEIIIPRGDSIIRAGDRLIIITNKNAIPKLEKLLTVKLEYF
jgi:trk system potassium uptake protein TrkA